MASKDHKINSDFIPSSILSGIHKRKDCLSDKSNEYTLEKKKRMANKISEIKSKEDLKAIRNIIFSENPSISVNRDSGGMLMFFQNLTPITYIKLDKYLGEIEINKFNKKAAEITKNSVSLSSDSDNIIPSGYRYSNKEKNVLRKKYYQNMMDEEKQESIKRIEERDKNNVEQKKLSIFSAT
jgi:hypothetical protein